MIDFTRRQSEIDRPALVKATAPAPPSFTLVMYVPLTPSGLFMLMPNPVELLTTVVCKIASAFGLASGSSTIASSGDALGIVATPTVAASFERFVSRRPSCFGALAFTTSNPSGSLMNSKTSSSAFSISFTQSCMLAARRSTPLIDHIRRQSDTDKPAEDSAEAAALLSLASMTNVPPERSFGLSMVRPKPVRPFLIVARCVTSLPSSIAWLATVVCTDETVPSLSSATFSFSLASESGAVLDGRKDAGFCSGSGSGSGTGIGWGAGLGTGSPRAFA